MDNLTKEKRKKITKWIIGVASACIVIYLGVQNIGIVADALKRLLLLIMPLIIGVAFALIVNVPMRFFESHYWPKTKRKFLKKIRRPAAYITSVILIIGILTGIMCLLIPELIEAINVIIKGANDIIGNFSSMTDEELAEHPIGNIILRFNWDELFDTLQKWLKEQSGSLDNIMSTVTEHIGSIGSIMNTTFDTIGMIFGGLFDIFVAIAFSIYILFSKEKLTRQACRLIRAWLPRRFGEWFIHACDVAVGNFSNFISGQTIEALIIGVLCMIGMLIFRIPYAPMVGALVGVTALIPVVGAFIGAIVGAFMILTVNPVKSLIFLIFLIILQQLEGNIIYP